MPFLIVVAVLAQTAPSAKRGPVAVVVSSKRVGAEAIGPKLAARVFTTLGREGISDVQDDDKTAKQVKAAGFSDARNCQGGQSCLTKLAVLLGPRAVVVSVDVGKIGNKLAVHLEALSAEGGDPLALSDFTAAVDNFGDDSAVPVTVFARALAAKMTGGPEPKKSADSDLKKPADSDLKRPADAPVIAGVEPVEAPPPMPPLVDVVAQPAPQRHSRIPGFALGGGALACFGVSAAFGVLGLQDKNAYTSSKFTRNGMTASHLSQTQLDQLASEGNMRFSIALTGAVVGIALAAASTFFFVRD